MNFRRDWGYYLLLTACATVLVSSAKDVVDGTRPTPPQHQPLSAPHTYLFCKDGILMMARSHVAWPAPSIKNEEETVPCPLT